MNGLTEASMGQRPRGFGEGARDIFAEEPAIVATNIIVLVGGRAAHRRCSLETAHLPDDAAARNTKRQCE